MARNPQIGTVPCPVVDCSESCAVRRFAQRAASDAARRKAGKVYADCPTHGRFGFDGSPGMQDYILENADIWGSDHSDAAAASDQPALPAPASAAPKPAPVSAPAAPAAPKSKGVFDW